MINEEEEGRSKVKLNVLKSEFLFNGVDYSLEDYVYLKPLFITIDGLKNDKTKFKFGRNIDLKALMFVN